MNVVSGRICIRRNLPYYIYGYGRKAYPLRCQVSSSSLYRCKVLVSPNENRNYSHHACRSWPKTVHILDLQQLSRLTSYSPQNVTNIRLSGLIPQSSYALFPVALAGAVRLLSTGTDPSSKLEETVRRLKEKHEEKLKEIHKIQDIDMRVKSVIQLDQETDRAVQKIKEQSKSLGKSGKKSLWQRFVDELLHYKSGFVLLFLDIRVVSKIVWKMARGNSLTRRENRQLVRTVGDLFRLVPFSVFVLVPFMEFLLPVALKLFPGMLPSTFTTKSERENKFRQKLVAKIEYAKFLQKTLDEMAPTDTKDSRSSESARAFVDFYKQIRESGKEFNNEQILKFSKLFEDDITLDNMTRGQLAAICRMLELPTVGTKAFLAFSIEMKLRNLKADDRVIRREGVESMNTLELQQASKERGMRALGLPKEQLIKQLTEWLDLSLNAKVPPSLLLLSRTLYLPQTLDPIAQLAATISTLPESAASRASAEIASKEGKTRNVVKLEMIKEEQKKIEEEAKEEAKIKNQQMELERKEKERLTLLAEESARQARETISLVQAVPVTDMASTELLQEHSNQAIKEKEMVDIAPIIMDTTASKVLEDDMQVISKVQGDALVKEIDLKIEDVTPKIVPVKERELSSEDFAGLKVAIEKLGKVKTELDTVDDIKKELADYQEDVEDLQAVRHIVDRSGLKESKGAQRLFSKVNKMMSKVDKLAKKKEKIDETKTIPGDELESDDNLVTINELIKAVQTSGTNIDNSKVEAMIEVLGLMDEDSDGVIKVDHILKVIELLGTAHAKLPAKDIRQIVEMLAKEDLLQVEENIEESMALHSDADDSFCIDAAYDQNLHDLEAAAKLNEELHDAQRENFDMNLTDKKYDLKDTATDIGEKLDSPGQDMEAFSDEKNSHPSNDEDEEIKVKVKLSDKQKSDPINLK